MHDTLTKHAQQRCDYRSIRQCDISAFNHFADFEVPARNGAIKLSLSAKGARHALEAGLASDQVARLRKLIWVIVDGKVVTQYRRTARRSYDRFGRSLSWAK
jgi:hypothetical protein